MNLQHWNLKDAFTVAQVARLINGWDPEIDHIGDAALAAKVRFIERELSNSVENAMQGLLCFFGDDLDKLGDASWVVRAEKGWLAPCEVERAITAYQMAKEALTKADGPEQTAKLLKRWTETLNRHYTSIEHKLLANERAEPNFRVSDQLSRHTVNRWLKSTGLKSEYSFEPLHDEKPLDMTASADVAPPHPRTEKYYVALITAMAIDKYGYDPEAARSSVPGDLSVLLGTKGFALTDEAIRRYLKDGAGHLNAKIRR